MRAIIPAAGQGTRLFPQTHTKPKPMVRVAGKPILGHILDNLIEARIDEIVVVVGVMKEMVIKYVEREYSNVQDVDFVVQERTEGLGHSVYQARHLVDGEPVCIVLGDMLFDQNYDKFISDHDEQQGINGSIGVKAVNNPSNYGVVTVENNRVVDLKEKPDSPDSNLAISGIYVVDDSTALFEALEYLIENDIRGAGDEYQLTDALKRMIKNGSTLGTFPVENWYDCGRPETLLKANKLLLERVDTREGNENGTNLIIPPVDIGEDVEITQSVVGPYVSVDSGAEISNSRIEHTIIGTNSVVLGANLSRSIIGDNSTTKGSPNRLNIGDSSEVQI